MVELFAKKFIWAIQTLCKCLFCGCGPIEYIRWIFWQRISCVSLFLIAYKIHSVCIYLSFIFFTRLPLIFVLMVTLVKDLFEDRRRYISDRRVNNSTCRVYKRYVHTTTFSAWFIQKFWIFTLKIVGNTDGNRVFYRKVFR